MLNVLCYVATEVVSNFQMRPLEPLIWVVLCRSIMLYCGMLLHVTYYCYVIRRLTCQLVLKF
jgi:hypothetical protein